MLFSNFQSYTLELRQNDSLRVKNLPQGRSAAAILSETSGVTELTITPRNVGDSVILEVISYTYTYTLKPL